jgi:hypothetical protein
MTPPVHATVRGTYVAGGQQLLPELLDRAGYHGLVVAANADLSGDRGLTQGFDASVTLSRGTGAGNDAEAVIAAVLAGRGEPGRRASSTPTWSTRRPPTTRRASCSPACCRPRAPRCRT